MEISDQLSGSSSSSGVSEDIMRDVVDLDDIDHVEPDLAEEIQKAIAEDGASTISSRLRRSTSTGTTYTHLKSPTNLEFESELPEKRDVDIFADWVKGTGRLKKEVFNQIFSLACCKVYETLSEDQRQYKQKERWALYRAEFSKLLLNFEKTDRHRQHSCCSKSNAAEKTNTTNSRFFEQIE